MTGSFGQKGFTLPELLVVGLMVGVLMIVTALFARPNDYSSQTRNAQRWLAVALQMQVLDRYVAQTGSLPTQITEKLQLIGSTKNTVDLCLTLASPYQDTLLYDPLLAGPSCLKRDEAYVTGLAVSKRVDNTVTITAPAAEDGEQITLVKRF